MWHLMWEIVHHWYGVMLLSGIIYCGLFDASDVGDYYVSTVECLFAVGILILKIVLQIEYIFGPSYDVQEEKKKAVSK